MATPTTLPAAFTAGQVLTAAQQNALRGAFRVLQVVQATDTTLTTISTNTFTSIGLSATITPSSTTSKILVFATVGAYAKQNNTYGSLRLFRGATGVFTGNSYLGFTGSAAENGGSASLVYLDSPATVSATTYEVKMNSVSNIAYVQAIGSAAPNSITLMEISA
jgi:hypothetical protein